MNKITREDRILQIVEATWIYLQAMALQAQQANKWQKLLELVKRLSISIFLKRLISTMP